jgi:hypothetical protein
VRGDEGDDRQVTSRSSPWEKNWLASLERSFVLAALLCLFSGLACARHEGTKGVGDVSVGLHIGPTTLASVHYQFSGNGISPRVGDIDVTANGATPSLVLGGIPAGNGYLLSLTAVSTDLASTCAGSATVNVVAGAVTPVTIELFCRRPDGNGEVVVNGDLHFCPSIGSFEASPLRASIGGAIDVAVSAFDDDTPNLIYSWTAPAGSGAFTASTQPATQFVCADDGMFTLTTVVSDGYCADSAHVTITCAPFCENRADGTSCNDKNLCTQTDSCQGDVCVGSNPLVCPPPPACHGANTCQPATGNCVAPVLADGTSCSLANATAACAAGSCALQACAGGFANCDAVASNGCEVNLATDTANCGSCGSACFVGATCVAGLCRSPPPSGVVASAGGWEITLTWNPSAGATTYTVMGATSPVGAFVPLGTTTGTSFVADTVQTGVIYFYVVASNSAGGPSAPSTTVIATPLVKQLCNLTQVPAAVDVYNVTQTATAVPVRSLSGASTGLVSPAGMSSDLVSKELFVSLDAGAIQVFALAASGNVAPLRTLSAPAGASGYMGLQIDPYAREVTSGRLLPTGQGEVLTLDETTGALKRSLSGAATTLGNPTDVALDRTHGELLVASTATAAAGTVTQLLSFDTAAAGATAPKRALSATGPARFVLYDAAHDELITSSGSSDTIFFYDRGAAGSTPAKRSMQIQSSGGRVQALLLDASTDMLWIMNRVGFTWQVFQVPRSSTGLVMPPTNPLVVSAGTKLARCN